MFEYRFLPYVDAFMSSKQLQAHKFSLMSVLESCRRYTIVYISIPILCTKLFCSMPNVSFVQ